MASDMRQSVSPRGDAYTLVGNTYRAHKSFAWTHVAIGRVWEAETAIANQSYERFFQDALLGVGHAWFLPGSGLKIYDQRGIFVGQDATISAWNVVNPPGLETLTMSFQQFTGYWQILWPLLVSAG
jgi:hypothetical protein